MVCAVAAIVATLLVVPLITRDNVPPSALLPTDVLEFEYAQRTIVASGDIIEREHAVESRVLAIDDSGRATLYVGSDSGTTESGGLADDESLHRLRALIKETGFLKIAPSAFLPDERPDTYELYTLSVTLNGKQKSVRWSAGEDGENFVPPIIIMIQDELDAIRSRLS